MPAPIVVVGAGLAGLTCARTLSRAGKEVIVFERDARVGGRVQTDVVDGYRLDRGFQVLFTAYPTCKEELDYSALNLSDYDAGAQIWDGKQFQEISRDDIVAMALSNYLSVADKIRLLSWNMSVKRMTLDEIWGMPDAPTDAHLRDLGFGERFINRFPRPFFSGIFLDSSLSTSRQMFTYLWKMLMEGSTAIPATGMGAIPEQIAHDLPADSIQLNTPVRELVRDEQGRVIGVEVDGGSTVEASAVVLATDPPAASRLMEADHQPVGNGCTTLYFAAQRAPMRDPVLLLNGSPRGRVNNVSVVSNVNPKAAPEGALISVTTLENPRGEDRFACRAIQFELRSWFPDEDVESWRPLRVYRIPFAQYAQPPGFREGRPPNTVSPGLYRASEITEHSSIEGAVLSGRRCAQALLESANA